MGQRGRVGVSASRAARCMARISPMACSITLAIFWCIAAGSLPSTK